MSKVTITTHKPHAAVKAIRHDNAREHAVFAMTKRGRGQRIVRLSEFMPYGDALARYGKLESYNARGKSAVLHTSKGPGAIQRAGKFRSTAGMADDAALGAGGGPILWLAVRSKQDPRFKDAPRATAIPRTKEARKARAAQRAL